MFTKKAEADLQDVGARHSDEFYSNKSGKAIRGYMKENGLNPDKYYKPDHKSGGSRSGHGSSSGTDGCYLTSACVAAQNMPDDCEELQILRSFRDHYLANQPGGMEEIEQYYAIAPRIVASINQRADAAFIWKCIHEDLIVPCVRVIREGENEEANQLYRRYSLHLLSLYGN